ncbi:MAG: hypothetical protein IT389_15530 [Nitrospira sp.]|nr:hypothetical protein [Nitrospira sp.]
MDELKHTRRIRLSPFSQSASSPVDDAAIWMGGEASVGTQAGRYVREAERNTPGLARAILGLTFLGGLALGAVVSSLLRKPRG